MSISKILDPGISQSCQEDVVFLHSNDVYSLSEITGGNGGYARAQTIVDQYSEDTSITTFGGDLISGGPTAMFFRGADLIEAMNQLGVDAAVFGNHEFDNKNIADTEKAIKPSAFPWLGANLVDKDGKVVASGKDHVVIEKNGHKIGIVGLVDDWTQITKGITVENYRDFVTVAKSTVEKLKDQGVEYIVALTHMTLEHDRQLATEVLGINLILGGHEHEPIMDTVGKTLILKAGSNFENVGMVSVDVDSGQICSAENIPVDSSVSPSPKALELITKYEAKLAYLKTVLANTNVDLDCEKKHVRTQETNFGNLVADAARAYVAQRTGKAVDVVMVNGGGLRAEKTFKAGTPLTTFDIFSAVPFNDTLVGVLLTGWQILASLENSVSDVENINGKFMQVSGLKFSYDPKQPAGNRVDKKSVMIGNKPVVLHQQYRVAVQAFAASGKENYTEIGKSPRFFEEDKQDFFLRQIIVDYLTALKTVTAKTEGRIKVTGE